MTIVRRPSPFGELLSLRLPKAEQVKPRQIKINPAGDGQRTIDRGPSSAERTR